MAKRPAKFTQAELTRAAKAVRATGLPVARTLVLPDGTFIFDHRTEVTSDESTPLDDWMARRDARSS